MTSITQVPVVSISTHHGDRRRYRPASAPIQSCGRGYQGRSSRNVRSFTEADQRTMATGQVAWCRTPWLTEPRSRPAKPP